MSTRHPFGWELPPGVSLADIERSQGSCDCDENLDELTCPRCGGLGDIEDKTQKSQLSTCPRCREAGVV